MSGARINCISGRLIVILSINALLLVLLGYTQPPQSDEGTLAHIFQIIIAALVLLILVFLATADWNRPLRSTRPLALPAVVLGLAFGALYYLEHCYSR